jgi:epoxyqueuosine reductase
MLTSKDFVSQTTDLIESSGVNHWGWVELSRPHSLEMYKDWLKAGLHASMTYLERHLEAKSDEKSLLPVARSAILVAKPYLPHPYPSESPPSHLRTALYARGRDYHDEFQAELRDLAEKLKQQMQEEEFLCFTDSAPILERDLAVRAGLGWVGKNTCVIHPKKGSLFFIGEILTTLPAPNVTAPIPDMCGTCDRCIKACPTDALIAPKVLDSNKCIAFWTIEARTPAPEALRSKIGDWFFGCDICQTVCPWNEKVFGKSLMQEETTGRPLSEGVEAELRSILQETNSGLRERFREVPLTRSRSLGLKRNAMYLIGNLKLNSLKDQLNHYANDKDLGELARWASSQLTNPL